MYEIYRILVRGNVGKGVYRCGGIKLSFTHKYLIDAETESQPLAVLLFVGSSYYYPHLLTKKFR